MTYCVLRAFTIFARGGLVFRIPYGVLRLAPRLAKIGLSEIFRVTCYVLGPAIIALSEIFRVTYYVLGIAPRPAIIVLSEIFRLPC